MSRHDWYRNTEWNDEIAEAFEKKLNRARDKSQYLRIQASILSEREPTIALHLLKRYFALGKSFDRAQAYVDQAHALVALGDIDAALRSYESALAREREYPHSKTQACLDLPYLIALRDIEELFDEAMDVLDGSRDRLIFPVNRFVYHAVRAMILTKTDPASARAEAILALDAAALDHSGFQYHPTVGLVSARHREALSKLNALVTLQ